MKSTAALGTATRTMGKFFFAVALILTAIAAGFGGTALLVFHQFGSDRAAVARNPAGAASEHKAAARPSQTVDADSQTRRVAAVAGDASHYTYADNNAGRPSTPAKRTRTAPAVPAPLDTPAPSASGADQNVALSDPESRLIVDSSTGRVVGIDGTAGARREQEESTPPSAVAVQTPEPEVRVASPVLDDGRPVFDGQAVPVASTTGTQFKPIRKALPVNGDEEADGARSFNVAEYAVSDDERPVLRAQPVASTGTRVVKSVRVYRLADGSQIVTSN